MAGNRPRTGRSMLARPRIREPAFTGLASFTRATILASDSRKTKIHPTSCLSLSLGNLFTRRTLGGDAGREVSGRGYIRACTYFNRYAHARY